MKRCVLLTVMALAASMVMGEDKGQWVSISDKLLADLKEQGKNPAWPGGATGVAVNRITGEVYVVPTGLGIWKSKDKGATFERLDGGKISGRCETGWALNLDPNNGSRMYCFMLDGASAMTLDLKTWQPLAGMGRGWDYGAVDWSQKEPAVIFAFRHESGGEMYLSTDGAKTWKKTGKDPSVKCVGVIGADTLVLGKDDGIYISPTQETPDWKKVADGKVQGRVVVVFENTAYVTTDKGIMASKDKGKTWKLIGAEISAFAGPFFGKKSDHIVAINKQGFQESTDGGKTWKVAAPLPPEVKEVDWFGNYAWDPVGNIFYATRMGKPAMKYEK